MAGHLLVVSPIPSEPRNQGNSARIAAMGSVLRDSGWIVHFLYHPLEGLDHAQRSAMQRNWDYFHVPPWPPRPVEPAGPSPFALDDWVDPALTEFARGLHRRWRFVAVVANYVWCSAVLEAFGRETWRLLDTHDVFGGRDRHFRQLGLPPAWFYTTALEEAKGLRRADTVLAVQEEEAEYFATLGHGDVRTIGHLLPLRRKLPSATDPVAGFLASSNPLNLEAFRRLQAAASGRVADRLVVAGTICRAITRPAPFTSAGELQQADDFYRTVDIALNPMTGGTGLKIKSVEAVHAGVPLLATADAMRGLKSREPFHRVASAEEVIDLLVQIRRAPALLEGLRRSSERCAKAYSAGVQAAYRALLGDLGRGRINPG